MTAPDDTLRQAPHYTPIATGYRAIQREVWTIYRQSAQGGGALDARALSLNGLVVDETQTALGRDFYEVFYSQWDPPQQTRRYSVTVQERPAPSLGTIVTVRINDEVVFQTRLQPRYAVIESAAQQAVAYAQRHLQRRQPSRLF